MTLKTLPLGQSSLQVTPICLGTMTFGEQVDEPASHAILDRSLARGVNFLDTSEMYSVPTRAATCGATETIMGHWFAKRPGARQKLVLATKGSRENNLTNLSDCGLKQACLLNPLLSKSNHDTVHLQR